MSNEAPISLAEIAGIDLNEVEAIRFELLPQIVGMFEITEAKVEMTSATPPAPIIIIDNKVESIEAIVGSDANKDDYVGKTQRNGFQVRKAEDVGRFKAFCEDLGMEFTGAAPIQEVLSSLKGVKYPGKITHRKDKNNPEIIYARVEPMKPDAAR